MISMKITASRNRVDGGYHVFTKTWRVFGVPVFKSDFIVG